MTNQRKASYTSYPVTITKWVIECGCPSEYGRIPCSFEEDVKGWLEHHEAQDEHIAWVEDSK